MYLLQINVSTWMVTTVWLLLFSLYHLYTLMKKIQALMVFLKGKHKVWHCGEDNRTLKNINWGFSPSAVLAFGPEYSRAWGCPVYCRMMSSISSFHPTDAISTPTHHTVTTKTVPRICHRYPRGQNCHQETLTSINENTLYLYLSLKNQLFIKSCPSFRNTPT